MQLSSLQTGLLEQHRRSIYLQFVSTTQYTIAKQSPVGMLHAATSQGKCACMPLNLYTIQPLSSSIALT